MHKWKSYLIISLKALSPSTVTSWDTGARNWTWILGDISLPIIQGNFTQWWRTKVMRKQSGHMVTSRALPTGRSLTPHGQVTWAGTWRTGAAQGRILGGHRPGSGGRKHKGSKTGIDWKFRVAARRPIWWSKRNKVESVDDHILKFRKGQIT